MAYLHFILHHLLCLLGGLALCCHHFLIVNLSGDLREILRHFDWFVAYLTPLELLVNVALGLRLEHFDWVILMGLVDGIVQTVIALLFRSFGIGVIRNFLQAFVKMQILRF